MTDQFVGEIRMFAGNFAPTGWALCNGQLMPISQNTALFSLLGTTYGGDGRTTFALPNLQGNVPLNSGAGAGLTQRSQGETGGASTVTLLQTEMPAHSHQALGAIGTGPTSPQSASWGTQAGRTPPRSSIFSSWNSWTVRCSGTHSFERSPKGCGAGCTTR